MTRTRGILSFLTCAAMIMVFHSKADRLPPPTVQSHEWLDPFTVNISLGKPSSLLDGCEVRYKYYHTKNGTDKTPTYTVANYFREYCLTEDMDCTFNIWTVGNHCNHSNESPHKAFTIDPPKRRAELVKDFKCVVHSKKMNCSWIPVKRSLNLTLSYRPCGCSDDVVKKLEKCDQPYSNGEKDGCYLPIETTPDNICVNVNTDTEMSTFIPATVVPAPEMNITEEGDTLKLRFTVPTYKCSCWIYEVCYKECGRPQNCQNFTCSGAPTMEVPYDKACLYEFQSRVTNTEQCVKISSSFSAVQYYGTNVPRIGTVVAIIIPVILSICAILSCSCFRRHSTIICPAVPDPSTIFKEMMNGNKERLANTTKGSLYTPVPEPVESCKITLVMDKNSILQQNC